MIVQLSLGPFILTIVSALSIGAIFGLICTALLVSARDANKARTDVRYKKETAGEVSPL